MRSQADPTESLGLLREVRALDRLLDPHTTVRFLARSGALADPATQRETLDTNPSTVASESYMSFDSEGAANLEDYANA